jgi:hypothetical protein
MKSQICTEADYLQAHLTVIAGGPRRRKSALQNLKHPVKLILKKWFVASVRIPG